ncbi:MAG TPA: 23S rRNA (guanosine(2251)-2'-O)-methyltransferase RlmB [Thermoleophilia bacterium]|nr:23S rRNA (guanosine(2251)-2'-O)-methyltransferase RlmB [Thermoleophilia bacterium]
MRGRRKAPSAQAPRDPEGHTWLAAHGVEAAAAAAGLALERAAARDLDGLTGSREHQGVACLVADYPYAPADELLARDLLVVLDEVTDPRNLGAIVRSALAAGAGGVVVPRHRSAMVTPAAVKAAAGASEHLDVARVTNTVSFLTQFKAAGGWAYGAAGDEGGPYGALDLTGKTALVFGAEGRGLRPLVRRTCDELGAIPMQGPLDSLNVSVAAALFLYEARRQRDIAATGGGGPAAASPAARPPATAPPAAAPPGGRGSPPRGAR